MAVRPLPGRLNATASRRLLIQKAYGVQPRLEATRGPVEVIVIDHVDRPSAN